MTGKIDKHIHTLINRSRVLNRCAILCHALYHKLHYRVFADHRPLELRTVDPDSIEYVTVGVQEVDDRYYYRSSKPYGRFYIRSAGQVIGGDWDKKELKFSDYIPYQSFIDHFEDGIPWQETEYFDLCLELIDKNGSIRGSKVQNREELLKWFQTRDDLYNKIKNNGYTKQTERYTKNLDMRTFDEVTVNVGRDGSLFYNDGKHRLSIAKILDLDKIPVRVVARHRLYRKTDL